MSSHERQINTSYCPLHVERLQQQNLSQQRFDDSSTAEQLSRRIALQLPKMPFPTPPHPTHILETILYVRSMLRSVAFYTETMGLTCVQYDERISIFPLGAGVLLLFQLGLTVADVPMGDDGTIPRHGPTEPLLPYLKEHSGAVGSDEGMLAGPNRLTIGGEKLRQHFCFAVDSGEDVDAWDQHLVAKGVQILGRVRWPDERGQSVYFADPDGNIGEVASKGIWDHLRKSL